MTMKLNVGLIGGGSWGTTIASLISRNCPTRMWARDPDTVKEINEQHTNSKYLKGAQLHPKLTASNSIEETVRHADVVVMGVPSQNFRQVLIEAKPFIRPWVPIVSLAKGLERGSKMRMTEVIEMEMPGHPAGALTGPNLAREIITGHAAASVIAMVDNNISIAMQKVFQTGLFRVYTNDDVIGCELGGALKNVIAIAAGMGDGAKAGDNTRSAVITRGLAELTRLGVAMGGKPSTFAGLTGMGDLVATCTSALSRNRTVGFRLGQGEHVETIIKDMSMVAEGVKTAAVVQELANEHGVEMPIVDAVCGVLYDDNNVYDAFRGLLKVQSKSEYDPG